MLPDAERTATVMNSVIADTRFRPSTPFRILASNDSIACLVRKQKKKIGYTKDSITLVSSGMVLILSCTNRLARLQGQQEDNIVLVGKGTCSLIMGLINLTSARRKSCA